MKSKKNLIFSVLIIGTIAGFILTFRTAFNTDNGEYIVLMRWIREIIFPFIDFKQAKTQIIYLNEFYSPLPTLMFGALSPLFYKLNDPMWYRTAILFGMYPTTLLMIYLYLKRVNVGSSTALLIISLIIGYIRLGGHATHNIADFPLAVSYIVVTFYMWFALNGLKQKISRNEPVLFSETIKLAVFSTFPFLSRPPMGIHIAVTFAFLLFFIFQSKNRDRFKFALACLIIPAFIYAVFTPLWRYGPIDGMYRCFTIFSHYPKGMLIKFFGLTYDSTALPRWYTFIWAPVGLHPIAFFVFIAGLLSLPFSWKKYSQFKTWVAFFTFTPLLVFFIMKPCFYDEDRHFLFIFMPLLVLTGLSLDYLKNYVKIFLSILILVFSLYTYVQWGIFSYAYQNPLINYFVTPDSFMGDYLNVCVNDAMKVFPKWVPSSEVVQVYGGDTVSEGQSDRFRLGLFSKIKDYPKYKIVGYEPDRPAKHVLVANKNLRYLPILADVQSGKAKLLWESHMPNGVMGCMLVEYL